MLGATASKDELESLPPRKEADTPMQEGSDRHTGTGRMQLMGMRNTFFDVNYDVIVHIRTEIKQAYPHSQACCGEVLSIEQMNGHHLPDGEYRLDCIQEIGLFNNAGTWQIHYLTA